MYTGLRTAYFVSGFEENPEYSRLDYDRFFISAVLPFLWEG